MSAPDDATVGRVAETLRRVLQLGPETCLDAGTQLLGGIPEFDSLAVASVVIALEERFDVTFDDDDITADMFATVGTLASAVGQAPSPPGAVAIDRAQSPDRGATPGDGPRPGFLAASSGRLYLVRRDPPGGPGARCVLFVPPFAEELNRVRPILTSAAVALNAAGLSTCLGDLHGTGDSDGDFADARWAVWMEDLHALIERLRSSGFTAIDLVAVRFGARLAVDYCRANPDAVARIVLWDPLLDGSVFLDRFLRTRSMAAMMSGTSESVAALRARLAAGETLEVGGYALHPLLATELSERVAHSGENALAIPVSCIVRETSARTTATASCLGIDEAAVVVTGHEPYWDSVEVTSAPELVAATVRCLAETSR